ncbi:MAG TPA: acetyltransferase [Xanthomonadales bacterium]|nr:acetyltransferase [Xanthomonadales bacterium]
MNPTRELVLFGAGGHAREVLALAREAGGWQVLGVLSDRAEWVAAPAAGVVRLGGVEWLAANPGCHVVVAIGDPRVRADVVARIRAAARNPFATLVHPRAWLAERVALGEGTQVEAGALLNVDVHVGSHAIVNQGARLSHDVRVGDFATLAPGVTLCGNAVVENGADVGANATVLPGIRVGANARVGAGAIVVRDVAPGTTVVGNPARPLER